MSTVNRILSPYRAEIRGRQTALAGCDSLCPRQHCIRKTSKLAFRANLLSGEKPARCGHYIERGRVNV